ncbi:MAG: hypothetical protein ACLTTR_05055 [Clostridia bacterium]|jgi:hypothetical protein|nr:hypothetical protein [Clostridium sp.]
MKDTEKLEKRLEELQKERNEKLKKDKQIVEEMMTNEQKRLQSEKERKKLKDEEEKIQADFSDKLGMNISQSKKLLGFIKRYVLIGIVTGVPGIALSYLWDKWQENKMLKDLYDKNIEKVANPNNKELAKEYEILRRKFYKAYDIDKIERLVDTSEEIKQLKNDKKMLEKLNEEIKKYSNEYEKNLDIYIENQIISETKQTEKVTEDEEELEIRRKNFYQIEGE